MEGSQNARTRLFVLNRTVGALEAAHGFVCVQAYDQYIAEVTRLFEVVYVAEVEQVETAVGEHDGAAGLPPGANAGGGLRAGHYFSCGRFHRMIQ